MNTSIPTDLASYLEQLQNDNSTLREEIQSLRSQLKDIVEEYTLLDNETTLSNQRLTKISSLYVSTTGIYFGAIRALWDILQQQLFSKQSLSSSTTPLSTTPSTPNLTSTNITTSNNNNNNTNVSDLLQKAQYALTGALGQANKAQKELYGLGLPEVAQAVLVAERGSLMKSSSSLSASSISTNTDSSTNPDTSSPDPLMVVAASVIDDLRKEEREVFTTAIKEVREYSTQLEQQIQQLSQQNQTYEIDLHDTQTLITQLQAQIMEYQSLPPATSIIVDGERMDIDTIRTLKGSLKQSQQLVQELNRTVASGRDAAMATTRAATANAAIETQTYIQRTNDAEARASTAEKQVQEINNRTTREIQELKQKLHNYETANINLTKTTGTLRSEIDALQDKAIAQSGVIDMLRSELADSQARLAKLHAHKSEMARSAARALREVEMQVETLSMAVANVKK